MRILEAQRVVEVVVTGEDHIRAGGLLERRHHLGVVLLARAEAEVMPAGEGAGRRWCRPPWRTEARNLRLGLRLDVSPGRETGEMGRVLLVVDVQRGFVNPFTDHVPGRIRRLIERGDHDPVLFTRFINRPDGPYRRFLDWHECAEPPETDLAPELAPLAAAERVFTKRGFTGISEGLADRLRELAPEAVTIVGIDTDMCVLKVALDIFDLGIRPMVLVDCCASTAGLQAHLAGLAVLARNIGADHLREAGLSDGFLGSPPDEATGGGQ